MTFKTLYLTNKIVKDETEWKHKIHVIETSQLGLTLDNNDIILV